MDNLKIFLDVTCHSGKYTYDKLADMGEIYRKGDIVPICLIEYNKDTGIFLVRFRLGLQANEIASLTYHMTIADGVSLHFDDDFIVDVDYGYLYGDDARKAFIQKLQSKAKTVSKQEDPLEGAIFVCEDPIFAFGYRGPSKTKIDKMWEENNGDF